MLRVYVVCLSVLYVKQLLSKRSVDVSKDNTRQRAVIGNKIANVIVKRSYCYHPEVFYLFLYPHILPTTANAVSLFIYLVTFYVVKQNSAKQASSCYRLRCSS